MRLRIAMATAFVVLFVVLAVLAIREGGGSTDKCLKGRTDNAACR